MTPLTRGFFLFSLETTYHEAKANAMSDSEFRNDFQAVRAALKGPGGPFAGWVVSGHEWESFNVEGNVRKAPEQAAP